MAQEALAGLALLDVPLQLPLRVEQLLPDEHLLVLQADVAEAALLVRHPQVVLQGGEGAALVAGGCWCVGGGVLLVVCQNNRTYTCIRSHK